MIGTATYTAREGPRNPKFTKYTPINTAREGPRNPKFTKYTPINTGRTRILEEALSAELIPTPHKFPSPPNADQNKRCCYHHNYSQNTEQCLALKDKIEELTQGGYLQHYVAKHEQPSHTLMVG